MGRTAADREIEILNQFSKDRYKGTKVLVGAGNTELFTKDILKLDLKSLKNSKSVINTDARLIGLPSQLEFNY